MPITIPRRITSLANRVLDDGDIHDGTTLEFHVNDDQVVQEEEEEECAPLKSLSPRPKQQFSSTVVESNPLYPSSSSPPSRTHGQQQQRKSLSEPTLSPHQLHSNQALGNSVSRHNINNKTTRSADPITTQHQKKSSSTAKCLIRKTFFLFRNRHGRRTAKEVPQQSHQQQQQQSQLSTLVDLHDGDASGRSMSQMGYSVQDLDGYDEYNEDDDSKSHWDVDSLSNNGGRTVVHTGSPTRIATTTTTTTTATTHDDHSPSSKISTRSCRKDVGLGDSLLQRQHAVVLCRPSTANLLEEDEEQDDVIYQMPSMLSSQTSIPEYGSDSESNPRIPPQPRLIRELSGLTQNTLDVSWADPFEMDQHFRTVTNRNTKQLYNSHARTPPPLPKQQQYPPPQRQYSTDTTDDLSVSSDPGGKLVAVEFEFSLDDDDEDDHHHELRNHHYKNSIGFLNDNGDDAVLSHPNNYLHGGAPPPLMSQSEPHHRHGYPPKLRYGTLHSMMVQDHDNNNNMTHHEAKPTTPMSGPTTSSGSVGLVSSGFSSLRDSTSSSPKKQQQHPQLMMQQQKQMNSSSLEIPMPSHLSSSIVHRQPQSNTYDSSIPLPPPTTTTTTSPSKHNLLDDEDGAYDIHNDNSYKHNTAMLWKKPKSPNRVTFLEDEEEQTLPLSSSSSPNKNQSPTTKSSSPQDVHLTAPLEPSVSMTSSLEPSTSPQPPRRRISPTLENLITECPPSPPTKRNSAYKNNSDLSMQPENKEEEQKECQNLQRKKTPTNYHHASLLSPLSLPPPPPPSHVCNPLDNANTNTRGQQREQQLPLRSPRRGLEDHDEMVKPILPSRRAISNSERNIMDYTNNKNGTTAKRPPPIASRFKTT